MPRFRVEIEVDVDKNNVEEVHGNPEAMNLEEFISAELQWSARSFNRLYIENIESVE